MKSVLLLLLGLVIGGIVGWYVRGLGDVRASTNFAFIDKLADPPLPFLTVRGSWRGGDLANKINTVETSAIPLRGAAICTKPTSAR